MSVCDVKKDSTSQVRILNKAVCISHTERKTKNIPSHQKSMQNHVNKNDRLYR